MKKLFVLVFALAMTMTVSAQITWNVKLGGGMSTFWGYSSKGLFVPKVSVGIEKPLSAKWSLMPSIEVAWKGFRHGRYDSFYRDEASRLLYLQIPIVAAYRVNLSNNWNLALKAGPYFAYQISAEHLEDYNSKKKFDIGLDVGFDFEFHRFVFGVEGEMGFIPLSDIDTRSIKNLAFYGTVGYKF